MSASSSPTRAAKSPLVEAAHFVRRSRSLASMLPSLSMTGVITLLVSGIERLMWVGTGHNFFKAWMESWLTVWPIAFPIVYLAGPSVVKFATRIAAQAGTKAAREPAGPALSGIEDASASAGAAAENSFIVRRKSKRSFEVA
jgi:hypothetical protein